VITGPSSKLLLGNSNEATLSSANHGFQIGNTNAQNLIFDTDRIQARNDGDAGLLDLNFHGGSVRVNNTYTLNRGTLLRSCPARRIYTTDTTSEEDEYLSYVKCTPQNDGNILISHPHVWDAGADGSNNNSIVPMSIYQRGEYCQAIGLKSAGYTTSVGRIGWINSLLSEGSTSNWGGVGVSFSYIYGLERKEAGLSTIKADTNLLATVTCGVFGDGITESDTDSVVVDHSTVE
ncbi:MAG: hypothetical protein HOG49_27820, partial [Candidatus Scalindua sp.]|nr:hypothetical protein [Candidatus Scalindua sp.]